MKNALVVLELFLVGFFGFADGKNADPAKTIGLSAGYFSENLQLPGYVVRVEKPLAVDGWHTFLARAGTGGVLANPVYDAFFLFGGIGYRLTFPFGLYLEAAFDAGYQHLFDAGRVVTVASGAVAEQPNWGYPMLYLELPASIGYDFAPLLGAPIRVFAAAGIVGEYPMNWWPLFHWVWEAGLTYSIW